MNFRTIRFIDSDSREWLVREEPSAAAATRGDITTGLRFESTVGLRYLESVPENWERLPWRILESLCACAREYGHAAA